MKRFAIGVVVLSSIACSSTAPTEAAASPAVSTDLQDAAAANVVPNGTFATIDALCDAQRKLAEPRIAEAKKIFVESDRGDLDIAPSCEEDVHALMGTKIVLGAGIREVKAILAEEGYSTQTYLVARTSAGWSPIRTLILSESHDDPGCPSIERTTRIVSVRVESGMVVVVNEASRYWSSDKEAGDLTLTYARACTVGATCSDGAVIAAKVLATDIENPDGPAHPHLFATTFSVSSNGVISSAKNYDDAML